MGIRLGGHAIREMQTLFSLGTMGSWTDGQLLAQYLTGQEGSEAALRVLIHRHGPVVLRVCRRILSDEHAVEDAFQATFLVLIKKAASLRDCKLLTNWLYGVAVRVARKERAKAARRRVVERRAAAERATWREADVERAELTSVIDEEIQGLPERYRVPLVLCHLEGLRHEDVARRLGCAVGTVESRLSRGREQLRSRLTRRGLAPTMSALGLILNPLDSSADVALASLIEPTITAAVRLSSHRIGGIAAIVQAFGQLVSGLCPSLQTGAAVSTLIACVGMVVMGFAVFRAEDEPPRPHTNVIELSANTSPERAEPEAKPKIAEVPEAQEPARRPEEIFTIPQTQDEPPKSVRSSAVTAPAISGIKIDGQLDDWPPAIPRYPIDKLLDLGPRAQLGTGGLKDVDLSTSTDLSAAFSVGFDLKNQLICLAVIVRDDKLIIGHASHLDTDAVEVYIDGLHSERRIEFVGNDEELSKVDFPVQQYVAIAGKGRIYGTRQVTNPILMGGNVRKTRTRMAYSRNGDGTIYEWAIQVFDHYPDKPTRLEPGKRIGFDLAVIDRDVPATTEGGFQDPQSDRPAWIYWGPTWRGVKTYDAGSLGTLILGK